MVVVHGSVIEVKDQRQGGGLLSKVNCRCWEWIAVVGSGALSLRWRIFVGRAVSLFIHWLASSCSFVCLFLCLFVCL